MTWLIILWESRFRSSMPFSLAVKLYFYLTSNHPSYAADALRVEDMSFHPGGKRACCRRASCMAGVTAVDVISVTLLVTTVSWQATERNKECA